MDLQLGSKYGSGQECLTILIKTKIQMDKKQL